MCFTNTVERYEIESPRCPGVIARSGCAGGFARRAPGCPCCGSLLVGGLPIGLTVLTPAPTRAVCPLVSGENASRSVGARQDDSEHCAGWASHDGDCATMRGHDRPHDRQPESAAPVIGAAGFVEPHEPLEDAASVGGENAWPVVGYFDDDVAAHDRRRHGDGPAGVADRVGQQVADHPTELFHVTLHPHARTTRRNDCHVSAR